MSHTLHINAGHGSQIAHAGSQTVRKFTDLVMRYWLAGALCLFALTLAPLAQATIPASERAVLINLYNSTNGDSWTNNRHWKTGGVFSEVGTECSWAGVECYQDHVFRFTSRGNNMMGSLPDLNALTNLHVF